MAIDRYDLEARYMPSLVASVPFLLISYYYLSGVDSGFWHSVTGLTVGSVGFTTAIFLVMVNFCRGVGKFIEERMFNQGLSFPTTSFLIDTDNNLSTGLKKRIIDKINKRFGIDLTHSTTDSESNRREIHEAVGQIRSSFYKKNAMLLQRNIQFGFAKNLLGGSLIASLVSVLALVISIAVRNSTAISIAIVILAIYVVIAYVSLLMIRFTARHYAQCLYDEFMNS